MFPKGMKELEDVFDRIEERCNRIEEQYDRIEESCKRINKFFNYFVKILRILNTNHMIDE